MQEIENNYRDKGVRVIGLVVKEDLKGAKQLLESMNASYTNIVIDESLNEYLQKFSYIPTTMFVDGKGEFARRFIVGGKTYEQFENYIETILKNQ